MIFDNIKRGEIYYTDLSPVVGSEQDGIRPVLIIQNNKGNRFSPCTIAAAITSNEKPYHPTHVQIGIECGLKTESYIMLDQVRTIDKIRLLECIGQLDKEKMKEVNRVLAFSFGFDEEMRIENGK